MSKTLSQCLPRFLQVAEMATDPVQAAEMATDPVQAAEMAVDPVQAASQTVLMASQAMEEGAETVSGYDFNKGVDFHALMASFCTSGFQATNLGRAVMEINKMVSWSD